MNRNFNECLWCNEPLPPYPKSINSDYDPTAKRTRGNFFCKRVCYSTASRSIRMGLARRKSSGKSGIQTMLLGLLLKTLEKHPEGLMLKDLIAITHSDYSDYCKLLNATKLHHYFNIYVRSEVYSIIDTRGANVYVLTSGTCLKDWIKPKYREYLEAYVP